FKYSVKINRFEKFDNHAALLIGIDSRCLYMLDPMYKDGQVIAKVPIKSFEKKWTMEYNDRYGYYSPHFYRVERVAIFYYAIFTHHRPKVKNSVWKKRPENPRKHLKEVKKWREKSESIENIVKEIRQRYEFMKIHRYHDMDYAHLKTRLLYIFWRKYKVKRGDVEKENFIKKLISDLLRLDKIDKKLMAKGIIEDPNKI
ncbi:MAG: hypothetical protein N2445_06355, partial [Acidobacteria bacterium]|nr:hypothetical protein [Acidobacteriota bacterium]